MPFRLTDGSPEPLGLRLDARGANVAVFSAHATAIELCLFDDRGEREIGRFRLPCRTGNVFHGHFKGIAEGQRYGLRVHGPYAPLEGHRFNPAKLLLDPYALALDRPFTLSTTMFGCRPDSPDGDLKFDGTDSAPFMPKAVAIEPETADPVRRARKPWSDMVIYELHTRGFTKLNAQVAEGRRGTFAALASPASVEHLTRLGVTAIEIMPAAAWVDERHLSARGLNNYWGYNPVAFMVPDPRLAPGGWDEVRTSVAALQAAGIEVIIDVVLNHTGEGDSLGPTLSLRGIDNATYYRLMSGNPRTPINDTGCGNTLALDRPPVVRLAMDALRSWAAFGGVDGFRFDLATTLGRREEGFDPAAPLLTALGQDPLLRGLRLIAEPWDIGPGGYRVGAFPDLWGEWNDQFRDALRQFWRGDDGMTAEVATRLSGSSDIFAPHRPPSRSINYIVAHDGFTLADLVSYEWKRNEANGEDNNDGTNANYSWNNGTEGATHDPAILAARRRDQRNLLASLMLARGTPLLAMGAEFGRTQGGNNNAYAQDNVTSWLDWDAGDQTLAAFTARLTALRAAHPALKRDVFLTGEALDASLLPDVEWRKPDGSAMQPSDWEAPGGRTIIAALHVPAAGETPADRLIVALHAGRKPVEVTLPDPLHGRCWRVCLDTSEETGDAGETIYRTGDAITVPARSVVVLEDCADHAERRTAPRSAPPQDLLNRLTRGAGIAADWHDIDGTRHVVTDATKRALLAAMGYPADSAPQVRESLARLAEMQDRRTLPLSAVARSSAPVALRMALRGPRVPTAVIIEREDGSTAPVRLAPSELNFARTTGIDGRRTDWARVTLPPQPAGRHRVVLDEDPDIACHLTVAPRSCYLPPRFASGGRATGVAAQAYALRRAGDQGIGDFTALGQLAGIAAEAGAATVGFNPLHALFPAHRGRASPYYPSDRRFLDPIYIDVTAIKGGGRLADALAERAGALETLAGLPLVDYAGVWTAKRAILMAAFEDFDAHPPTSDLRRDFEAFSTAGGRSLWDFACFQAISEIREDAAWRQWPAGLSTCDPHALDAFAAEHGPLVRFHLFLQWLADRQLGDAAARARESGLSLGFYRDLAVGAAPDGAEVWANADQFLSNASIGAPPDLLAPGGQNWGLQPPDPLGWRASGFWLFNEVTAANMRYAGLLRIDHVMGLMRLFVIPDGARAGEGAYLSYPVSDLVAQIALESVRASSVVVGEDLGTVPENFREVMDGAGILSYRVMWFERHGEAFRSPEAYPAMAAACVSTHDLPTLVGWWMGEDIREREALGLISASEAAAARAHRLADKRALAHMLGLGDFGGLHDLSTLPGPQLAAAAHRFIAQTPSCLAMAQLDDLAGEVTAVNLPGTVDERPNWRRRLGLPLEKLRDALATLPRRR